MLLQSTDYGFDGDLPDEQVETTVKQSPQLFNILSDSIYTDKILAVIREPASNAYDAHVAAKKTHVPFKIKVPSAIDPTFAVEDEGTGIDPTKIKEIYFTYGESTKTKRNDMIGALGLGCKSPLAYTKSSFVVKNRYQGVEHTYFFFLNQKGIPSYSTVSSLPTDALDGLTVEFAVRSDDVRAFRNRVVRFFRYWEQKPQVIGTYTNEEIFSDDLRVSKVVSGQGWFLEHRDRHNGEHQGAVAIQGNVPYPVNVGAIPNITADLVLIASNPFVINFDMGTLGFTPSRESLSYDEFTSKNLIERLEEVRNELQTAFSDRVFRPGQTQVEFRVNFADAFKKVVGSMHHLDSELGTDVNEWFSQLLLGKPVDDQLTYNGYEYPIKDLIARIVNVRVEEYLPFEVSRLDARGKSARHHLISATSLELTVKADVPGSDFYARYDNPEFPAKRAALLGDVVKAKARWIETWRSAKLTARQRFLTTWDCAVANIDRCNAVTKLFLKLSEGGLFVINDVGSQGPVRFKLLKNQDCALVNFNPRETNPADVQARLAKLLTENGLSGSEVKLLSTLPDLRAAIQKVVVSRDSMKLKFKTVKRGNKRELSVGHEQNVTVPIVRAERVNERVFTVLELQQLAQVPYLIKRRSENAFYDSVTAVERSTIVNDNDTLSLASSVGFLDGLFDHDTFTLLTLTAGQLAWLRKRKVNLVAIGELIKAQVTDLEAREQFVQKVKRIVTLEKIGMLGTVRLLHHRFKRLVSDARAQANGASLLWNLYTENEALTKTSTQVADSFSKLALLSRFTEVKVTDADEVAKLKVQLKQRYPMLSLLGNMYIESDDQASSIIGYITERDV